MIFASRDTTVRYTSAEHMTEDDFGDKFTMLVGELVYNAKTNQGPWATMSHRSWLLHRATERLETGIGQKYQRQSNGHLVKIAG